MNNKNKIEAIFLICKGYFLYKFIDNDELFHSIIDIDLPIEILNAISLKLLNKQTKNTLYNIFRNIYLKIFLE